MTWDMIIETFTSEECNYFIFFGNSKINCAQVSLARQLTLSQFRGSNEFTRNGNVTSQWARVRKSRVYRRNLQTGERQATSLARTTRRRHKERFQLKVSSNDFRYRISRWDFMNGNETSAFISTRSWLTCVRVRGHVERTLEETVWLCSTDVKIAPTCSRITQSSRWFIVQLCVYCEHENLRYLSRFFPLWSRSDFCNEKVLT